MIYVCTRTRTFSFLSLSCALFSLSCILFSLSRALYSLSFACFTLSLARFILSLSRFTLCISQKKAEMIHFLCFFLSKQYSFNPVARPKGASISGFHKISKYHHKILVCSSLKLLKILFSSFFNFCLQLFFGFFYLS